MSAQGIPADFDKDAFIREWVRALRSGKYRQGKQRLKTSKGRFCCLGVACDLLAAKGIGSWVTPVKQSYSLNNDNESSLELPPAVAKALGLDVQNNAVFKCTDQGELALLNDDESYTFAEIADTIEMMALSDGVVI